MGVLGRNESEGCVSALPIPSILTEKVSGKENRLTTLSKKAAEEITLFTSMAGVRL